MSIEVLGEGTDNPPGIRSTFIRRQSVNALWSEGTDWRLSQILESDRAAGLLIYTLNGGGQLVHTYSVSSLRIWADGLGLDGDSPKPQDIAALHWLDMCASAI